jgi:hypothetical protein
LNIENISSSSAYVANLLTSDVQRIYDACIQFHILYTVPIETLVIIVLLIYLIGVGGFIAFFILILIIPILIYAGKRINILRFENVKYTDERLSVIQEAT